MAIVLFDGECRMCDRSVQFIMKRDPKNHFKFASLQSDKGKAILKQAHAPLVQDSLTVVSGGQYFTKSAAVLYICRHLHGLWRFFYFFKIIPRPVRDGVYDFVAKNRYKWLGKKKSCHLPSPEDRQRFL